MSKETYYSVKRDLLQCQKRIFVFRDIELRSNHHNMTYYSVKRALLQCQKRPTTVSKETYYSVKRALLQCQKRIFVFRDMELRPNHHNIVMINNNIICFWPWVEGCLGFWFEVWVRGMDGGVGKSDGNTLGLWPRTNHPEEGTPWFLAFSTYRHV